MTIGRKGKRTKGQKGKKTKRQKDKRTKGQDKKTKGQKGQKNKRTKRPKREYNIVMSGQFRTLAMFCKYPANQQKLNLPRKLNLVLNCFTNIQQINRTLRNQIKMS